MKLAPDFDARGSRGQAYRLSCTNKVVWVSRSGIDDPAVCLTDNHEVDFAAAKQSEQSGHA